MRAHDLSPRPFRRPVRASSVVAAGVIVVLVAAGCGSDDEQAPTTASVSRGDVAEVVDAAGTVQPRASSVVSSPAAGTVATLQVSDGQEVVAGQVLMTIESPSAVQALAEAERADADAAASASSGSSGSSGRSVAQVAAAQRQAQEDARARFATAEQQAGTIADPSARAAALAAVAASRTQYELLASQTQALVDQVNQGLGNLDSAVSSLSAAQRVQTQAAVKSARATVDGLTVVAPIAGKVSLAAAGGSSGSPSLPAGAAQLLAGSGLDVSGVSPATDDSSAGVGTPVLAQGAAVSSGARLVSVVDSSTLSLTADVDETDVLRVRSGMAANVSIDAVDGAVYHATVTSVDPTPTSGSGGAVTYAARLSYDGGTRGDGSPAPAPLPGMSATVSLVVRSVSDVVEVPASAIVRAGADNGARDSDSVYVVSDGRAERREVAVGLRGASDVQITRGLDAGEQVVTDGATGVTQGQRIS